MRRVLIQSDSREVESYSSRNRKVSPSDVRRKQKRLAARALENRQAIEKRRAERDESWADGGRDEFLAYRQDTDLAGLGQERRELRAAARASAAKGAPEPVAARTLGIAPGPVEGLEVVKGDPVREVGSVTVSLEVAVVKGCECHKIAYSSRREALVYVKRGYGIRAYHCPAADVWHLTSKPDGPIKKRYDRFDDPDAAREQERAKKKVRKSDARLRAALAPAPKPATVKGPEVSRRTACKGCGRLWLSDLNPQGRACPACGGEIRLGRDAADRFGL